MNNNKKEFLTEENYERGKKKLSNIALGVLLVGFVIGAILIAVGIVKSNGVGSNAVDLQRQIDELNAQISAKQAKCASLSMTDANWFAKSSKCSSEEFSLTSELNDLKTQLNRSNNNIDSIPYYMFAGFVILSSGMIALWLYVISKRREILAFTVQQTMPVATETVEKVAPTVGKAVGEVAKGVTKGIKKGLKDEE